MQTANRDMFIRYEHIDPFSPMTPTSRNERPKYPKL